MKTIKRIIAVAAVAALVTAAAAAQELTASISKITGKVEVETPAGWVAAKPGQIIRAGTTISTGFRSTAELTIGASIITVKALTRLTLAELAENAGVVTTNLNLRVGKVSAEVKSVAGKTQDFKVKSPISTASVRGTGFDFDGEKLEVRHGLVEFADNVGNVAPVPAGEAVQTSADGSGGVVTNDEILNDESEVVADAASDFGDDNAAAFETDDAELIDDFSEIVDTEELTDFLDDYFDTLLDDLYDEEVQTGTLVITIK